ncbi:MAG: hypothetical protein H0W83_04740 [Planctomycetes bacterium]|nr:hypothetical protein [Planctomycetota bacterium]
MTQLRPLMTDAQWRDVRSAMLSLELPPRRRTRDVVTGHISDWDRGWYYQFAVDAHKTVEWVEVWCDNERIMTAAIAALARIPVPVQVEKQVIRIMGYGPGDDVGKGTKKRART